MVILLFPGIVEGHRILHPMSTSISLTRPRHKSIVRHETGTGQASPNRTFADLDAGQSFQMGYMGTAAERNTDSPERRGNEVGMADESDGTQEQAPLLSTRTSIGMEDESQPERVIHLNRASAVEENAVITQGDAPRETKTSWYLFLLTLPMAG